MTKKHALNSVAAKFRKKIEREDAPLPNEPRRYIPHPRAKAKWRIQLQDEENGDSFTLRLYRSPWPGRWVYSEPNIKGLEDLFTKLRVMINNAA